MTTRRSHNPMSPARNLPPTPHPDHGSLLSVFPHGTGSPKRSLTYDYNPAHEEPNSSTTHPHRSKPTNQTKSTLTIDTNQPPDSESQPNTEWRTHHHPSTEDPNRMLGDDPDEVLHHRRIPLTATHSPTHFSYNLHPQRATHPTIHRNQMVHQV